MLANIYVFQRYVNKCRNSFETHSVIYISAEALLNP
jgi:hypothetical protein